MKLRKFVKDVVFSSLAVILMSSSVLATDLDDKNRLSLNEFSEEEQNKIIQELNAAGMADAIEEEHLELADEASEIESVRLAEMAKMTNMGNQRKKGLSLENLKPLTEEEKQSVEDGSYKEDVIVSSSSAKSKIDPTKIKATTIKEVPQVTEAEVKADFRYSLTSAQQKKNDSGHVYTNYMNNALKMRIQLEKMFDTKVDARGGQGKLYYAYFAGSTNTDKRSSHINYARAFVNSQFSKDLENNKAMLAKLAAETFADIDGTESYAYLIPTSVYYGLIDVQEVTAEQAAKSGGKYKAGDLLTYAKTNVTYAKLSKLIEGYDGNKQNLQQGKLVGTEYSYMGNIHLTSLAEELMTKEVVGKSVVKGELVEAIMNTSYLTRYVSSAYDDFDTGKYKGVYKDFTKWAKMGDGDYTVSQERAFYTNCIANPSKGVPSTIAYSLIAANKAGINLKDAQGNSNWNKPISLGESLKLFYQAAKVDE